MKLNEILTGGGITAAVVVLLSLIQVSPLQINPWTWLGKAVKSGVKALGRALNGEVLEKVGTIETEVTGLKEEVAGVKSDVQDLTNSNKEQDAINQRVRILRFGDEVLHNQKHTKDHFDSVLKDTKMYSRYCETHPTFENGVTEQTIERIKEVYQERLEKNDFL